MLTINNISNIRIWILMILLIGVAACQNDTDNLDNTDETSAVKLFQLKKSEETGVSFKNNITETEEVNYFNFMHIYLGAGVAVGDFNDDGLQDIYFVSSTEADELYVNNGNLNFKKLESASVSAARGFKTGVTVADVNGDGLEDIYVCRSGWFEEENMKKNLLYINQGIDDSGNPTFIESAEDYGLASSNNSIQSSFFDYDNDGDLDMFLINTPVDFAYTNRLFKRQEVHADKSFKSLKGYDQLFENQGNGKFEEVTEKAGIQPDIGFGLSVLTADFNQDGWTDIYIGNDFMTPDYFYINKGDGTFEEVSEKAMKHTSYYSMGADIGDINNDGLLDLFVLDMMPEDYKRSKTSMSMMPPEKFFTMVDWGNHYQYMHNVLQLNNGNQTFSEIAQMAQVEKTDWSWTPIIEDFDNNGYSDIFVTNGIKRDVTNQDYTAKIRELEQSLGRKLTFAEVLDKIPSQKLSNYAFSNNGDLTFKKVSTAWGLTTPSFSSGAASADFDLDGDLDLVVNNIDDEAFIFENQSQNSTFLRVQFEGKSSFLNAKVFLKDKNNKVLQYKELLATRGYMSCMEKVLHFGIGNNENIPTVEVIWNDGKREILTNVKVNQVLKINYNNAINTASLPVTSNPIFKEATTDYFAQAFYHIENEFNDYKNQVLLPHRQSQNGPAIATGDINGDGLEDIYVCGAHLQAGQLYLQNTQGGFTLGNNTAFNRDFSYEDVNATFLDIDLDNDLDLYVVSGGFEFPEATKAYQDRLYVNDGQGNFTNISANVMPRISDSGSCVKVADMDGDGIEEVFVGGRVIPDKYPYAPNSILLKVQNGRYENMIEQLAPELKNIGMVTDAIWTDFNGDKLIDLIVIGEWMNIEFFKNENNQLIRVTEEVGMDFTTGWWNSITEADLDQDGDMDYIIGNLGLNYKFHASIDQPFHVFCDDFDGSGTYEIVLAKNYSEELLPIRGKTCSSEQMPEIGEKFPTFSSFADADIKDIYGDKLKTALHYEAEIFESIILEKTKSGFKTHKLPNLAQTAPIRAILVEDFDRDGKLDLLIAGNHHHSEVETTRADAGTGLLLKGLGDMNFEPIPSYKSGFFADKDVRTMKKIGNKILVANNDDLLQVFEWFRD